ncbi:FAD-binding protein, partial [uncultured Brachyspira sp.]|uniref:FAD-binding protein n=1 Tax=uncultured Brachyspira sp. TaxID=221953 RepID=UPI00345C59BF
RLLIYSAAAMKDRHEPYGTESAMAKLYASEIGLEVVNQALQIHGGNGYIKGAYIVERAYRDAKICTIYEGTSEIQKVVISASILGKMPKAPVAAAGPMAKKGPITGERRNIIFKEGSAQDKVDALVAALKKDGIDFSVGIDINTPIINAERVVSAGKGIGAKENMKLVEDLAKAAGAAIGCSRPVAEELKYLPIIRYVGMSGQKFNGNLYIACGISGANQHLKGIKNASIIVAINKKASAKIFKNADYGIVGDVLEILPLLTKALGGTAAKKPAEIPYKKMKKITPKKTIEIPKIYVCTGCGYEYNPLIGDPESEVAPGTDFTALPEEWVCPECSEEKTNFIKA